MKERKKERERERERERRGARKKSKWDIITYVQQVHLSISSFLCQCMQLHLWSLKLPLLKDKLGCGSFLRRYTQTQVCVFLVKFSSLLFSFVYSTVCSGPSISLSLSLSLSRLWQNHTFALADLSLFSILLVFLYSLTLPVVFFERALGMQPTRRQAFLTTNSTMYKVTRATFIELFFQSY